MEIKQCEYIITIAEQGSISRAAEKLFLTQSALNQQLLKLEKELGAPLFIRLRNRWTTTEVGEVYLQSAREILRIRDEAYSRIEDLAGQWRRTLTIGVTKERGMQMFAGIYNEMHRRYPDMIFQPVEANVSEQNRMLDAGQIDIGFQTITEPICSHLEYHTILFEPFLLCIPRSHPLAYDQPFSSGDYPTISLNQFKDDPFTIVEKLSTMRVAVDRLFKEAGFQPKRLFDCVEMHAMQRLTAGGVCCSILPRFYATRSEKVCYFRLGDSVGWELMAVHRRDHHLNKAARDFIAVASDFWRAHPYMD